VQVTGNDDRMPISKLEIQWSASHCPLYISFIPVIWWWEQLLNVWASG